MRSSIYLNFKYAHMHKVKSDEQYRFLMPACVAEHTTHVFMVNLISGDKLWFMTRDFRLESAGYPLLAAWSLARPEDVRGHHPARGSCYVLSVGWSEWMCEGGVVAGMWWCWGAINQCLLVLDELILPKIKNRWIARILHQRLSENWESERKEKASL